MEVKTLHDHLVHGRVNALQEKLNLKEWLGFANGDFEYSDSDWNSYEDYENFVLDASTYPSLVGCVERKGISLTREEATELAHLLNSYLSLGSEEDFERPLTKEEMLAELAEQGVI